MAAPQGLLKIFQSKENSYLKLSIHYLGHHFKSIYKKSAKFDEVPWQAKARLRFRILGLLQLLKVILYLSKKLPFVPLCAACTHVLAINEAIMARKAKAKTAITAYNTRRSIVLLFPVGCCPLLSSWEVWFPAWLSVAGEDGLLIDCMLL